MLTQVERKTVRRLPIVTLTCYEGRGGYVMYPALVRRIGLATAFLPLSFRPDGRVK